MATVRLTPHLVRFFPALEPFGRTGLAVTGDTVAAVVTSLDARFPGIAHYVRDEQGRLRKHVNVFVDDVAVAHRDDLSDAVGPDSTVFILQALSGG